MRLVHRVTDALLDRLAPRAVAHAVCRDIERTCTECENARRACCTYYLGGCPPYCVTYSC